MVNGAFERNKKGVFVVMGDRNPKMGYRFPCKSEAGITKDFYVKYIDHTGVTEKLLDMPECYVTLGSDSVELSFDNKDDHHNSNENHQTIIDPDQVKAIHESIQTGKIFVINIEGNLTGITPYKVLQCKNSACIHWDGWWPIRLLSRYVKQLNGFDKAEDVTPEKEITINLSENKKHEPAYTKNQLIFRWIKGLSLVSSCAVLYYVLQDKIDEFLKK